MLYFSCLCIMYFISHDLFIVELLPRFLNRYSLFTLRVIMYFTQSYAILNQNVLPLLTEQHLRQSHRFRQTTPILLYHCRTQSALCGESLFLSPSRVKVIYLPVFIIKKMNITASPSQSPKAQPHSHNLTITTSHNLYCSTEGSWKTTTVAPSSLTTSPRPPIVSSFAWSVTGTPWLRASGFTTRLPVRY